MACGRTASLGVILALSCLLVGVTSTGVKIVEVSILVDDAGFAEWKQRTGKTDQNEFEQEMKSSFFEMAEVIKSLKGHTIDVEIRMEQLVVYDHNVLTLAADGKVETTAGLQKVRDLWEARRVQTNDINNMILFYTGHDLKSSSGTTVVGQSYRKAVCTSYNVAVIRLDEPMKNAMRGAAHIGNLMGANYDGSGEAASCANSGNIMDFNGMYAPSKYQFSSCSINSIKAAIDDAPSTCWNDANALPVVSAPRLGHYISPDVSCQRHFGSGSYLYRKGYTSYGDAMCARIQCYVKEGDKIYLKYADTLPGMNCDANKQCIQGACVDAANGDPNFQVCPYGDQPSVGGSKTCDQLTPLECDQYEKECCNSYKDGHGKEALCLFTFGVHTRAVNKCLNSFVNKTADEVCQSYVGAHSALHRYAYRDTGYGNYLCSNQLKCVSGINGETTINYVNKDVPNGMFCGEKKQCINDKCVETGHGTDQFPDSCPSGDSPALGGQYKSCDVMVKDHQCQSFVINMCCVSCSSTPVTQAPSHVNKTADEVCQTYVGPNSVLYRYGYQATGYGNYLCSNKLKCVSAVDGNQVTYLLKDVPNGMLCGENKQCIDSKCMETEYGTAQFPDSCPAGDSRGFGGIYEDCDKLIAAYGCQSFIINMCCISCPATSATQAPAATTMEGNSWLNKTAHEVCQEKVDASSAMFWGAYDQGFNDNLCQSLKCVLKVENETAVSFTSIAVPNGMFCGENKQCVDSKCVKTEHGTAQYPDWCPSGDGPALGGQYESCDKLKAEQTCKGYVSKMCCITCAAQNAPWTNKTADEVCKNLVNDQSSVWRKLYHDQGYHDNLCDKLHCIRSVSDTGINYGSYDTPNGVFCGENKQCIDNKCVSTGQGSDQFPDTCPSGDGQPISGVFEACDILKTQGCLKDASAHCCITCSAGEKHWVNKTADSVCRDKWGTASALWRGAYNNIYGHNLCESLHCVQEVKEDNTVGVKSSDVPNGMFCGNNKQCIDKKCIETEQGTDQFPDSCPSGDGPALSEFYTDCATLKQKYTCQDFVKKMCCITCSGTTGEEEEGGGEGETGTGSEPEKTWTNKTADAVCQDIEGSHSALWRKPYHDKAYGNSLCVELYCFKAVDSDNKVTYGVNAVPDGMFCGLNKQCINSECVETSHGSTQFPDSCPSGDSPALGGVYKSCNEMMAKQFCLGFVDELCCVSCKDLWVNKTAHEVCKVLNGPNSALYWGRYSNGYVDALCSTLDCVSGIVGDQVTYLSYDSTPNGMFCGKNKQCVDQKCVTTGHGTDQYPDYCPSGDGPALGGSFESCDILKPKHGCQGFVPQMCCMTCTVNGNPNNWVNKTANEVCQGLIGSHSAMHWGSYGSGYRDNLCASLKCIHSVSEDNNITVASFDAPNGMFCGMKSQCVDNKCVETAYGSDQFPDSCPSGDGPDVGQIYKSCSDLVAENNNDCPGFIEQKCCITCPKIETERQNTWFNKTADEVCKEKIGASSVMHWGPYENGYNDDLCVSLTCVTSVEDENRINHKSLVPPKGMFCGENKQCINSKCVETDFGTDQFPDHCPAGDRPALGGIFKSCEELRKQYVNCEGFVKDMCCVSCNQGTWQNKTADEICKDRISAQAVLDWNSYSEGYNNNLCETLVCITSLASDNSVNLKSITEVPNGMFCGENKQCIDSKCVETDFGTDQFPDHCPAGDRPALGGNFKSCEELQKQYVNCEGFVKDMCCVSCNQAKPKTWSNKTADAVCKDEINAQSAMWRDFDGGYGDAVCNVIKCVVEIRNHYGIAYTPVEVPDGMFCGEDKQCIDGNCVATEHGSDIYPDSCPSGDSPALGGFFESCSTLIGHYGCQGFIIDMCCVSCAP